MSHTDGEACIPSTGLRARRLQSIPKPTAHVSMTPRCLQDTSTLQNHAAVLSTIGRGTDWGKFLEVSCSSENSPVSDTGSNIAPKNKLTSRSVRHESESTKFRAVAAPDAGEGTTESEQSQCPLNMLAVTPVSHPTASAVVAPYYYWPGSGG